MGKRLMAKMIVKSRISSRTWMKRTSKNFLKETQIPEANQGTNREIEQGKDKREKGDKDTDWDETNSRNQKNGRDRNSRDKDRQNSQDKDKRQRNRDKDTDDDWMSKLGG